MAEVALAGEYDALVFVALVNGDWKVFYEGEITRCIGLAEIARNVIMEDALHGESESHCEEDP